MEPRPPDEEEVDVADDDDVVEVRVTEPVNEEEEVDGVEPNAMASKFLNSVVRDNFVNVLVVAARRELVKSYL